MKTILLSILLGLSMALHAQSIDQKKDIKDYSTKAKLMAKAPKKVYIRTFKVYYQMIAEAEKTKTGGRQIGGGSYKGNATARMAVGVKGVEVDALQELTNKLYNEFTASLKADGLEVLTSEDIPNIEYFDGWSLVKGPHINQEQYPGFLMIVPNNYSYFVRKVTSKGKEKTGGTYQDKAYKISDQLDDKIVADVEYKIPSIWLDASAKLGTAKVKGGGYLRISPESKVNFQSGRFNKASAFPKTSTILKLKNDIPINGVFSGEKFKAVATQSRTNVPSYATFFTVDNTKVQITNYIECKQDTYISKVYEAMHNYMDICLEKFKNSLHGEK